jgi:hypothetical protein
VDFIWILIPLAPFMVGAFAIWTKHQQKLAESNLHLSAEKAAQYASQNRALEERVRVLERIVTDKGYDVSLQIEALRDQRQTDVRVESSAPKIN